MPTPRKTGLSASEWHESLLKMKPAYQELVRVCRSHQTKSAQYMAAEQVIAILDPFPLNAAMLDETLACSKELYEVGKAIFTGRNHFEVT